MLKKRMLYVAVLVFCVTTVAGCKGGKAGQVLAKVGGVAITQQDFAERVAQFPKGSQDFLSKKENREKILDQMVDEEILVQQAKKSGYAKSKDYKDQIERVQRQILVSLLIRDKVEKAATVTDADLRQFYDANKALFDAVERRNLSHILVASEADANRILGMLKGHASFSDLAKRYSIDPSKVNGGELGWLVKSQVVPEFGNAAFAIPYKGGLSGIVKTQFGYHIIRFNDSEMRKAVDFDQAKSQIYATVANNKRQDKFKDLLEQAKEKIKVTKDASKL